MNGGVEFVGVEAIDVGNVEVEVGREGRENGGGEGKDWREESLKKCYES